MNKIILQVPISSYNRSNRGPWSSRRWWGFNWFISWSNGNWNF